MTEPTMGDPATASLMRDVIREVLREVVADEVATTVRGLPAAATVRGLPAAATGDLVTVRTQEDLDAAIRRVLDDARSPGRRRAIESGQVRFVLDPQAGVRARPASAPAGHHASAPVGHHVVEQGVLTERKVIAASRAGCAIVVTSKVVITPLARERARALGVEIQREN